MAIKDAIDVLGKWGEMGLAMQNRQDLMAAAGVKSAQWGAEQAGAIAKTMFESEDDIYKSLNDLILSDEKNLEDENFKKIYNEAYARRTQAYRDWLSTMGISAPDRSTDVIQVVDSVFAETDAKYLKWGDNKGAWAKVIARLPADVDLDLVEIVWNDRYRKKKDAGEISPPLFSLPEHGKELTSRVLGAPVHGATKLLNLPGSLGAAAESWWTGERAEPFYSVDPNQMFMGRDWWRGAFGDPKSTYGEEGRSLNPFISNPFISNAQASDPSLSQYEEAAQRRVNAQNLLANTGVTQSLTPRVEKIEETIEPLMGGSGLLNGFLAQPEEDEPDLSERAIAFLVRLAEMIQEHGQEKAYGLMTREYQQLARSDKQDIENTLRQTV